MEHFIIALVILFFSSMIQAMIGFAFNLIAIPLLIWSGFSLAESVVLTVIPIFVQLSVNFIKLKEHIVWQDVKLPIIIRYITLPIGIWILYKLNTLDTTLIKQIVGLILLLIIALDMFVSFEYKEKISILWTILAFSISGVMLGMLGMGGPAIVVWLMMHNWSAKRVRAFITTVFLFASPVQIALLYWQFSSSSKESFLWGLWATPIVILGALIGVMIGNKFDRLKLRKAVLFFLFLTAIFSIFSPYIH